MSELEQAKLERNEYSATARGAWNTLLEYSAKRRAADRQVRAMKRQVRQEHRARVRQAFGW